jgi:hypothetical protein
MSKMTFQSSDENIQASEVPCPCPKTANSRGELRCPHHSTKTSSTNRQAPTIMSFTAPLRQQSLRAFESWTCASCSRSLSRLPRIRDATTKPTRRWLTTTKETRQSHVPRMDQMHARYKEKNRTVMYAIRRLHSEQLSNYCTRNYTFSVIVGFVAITYGSVPMYKMVHYTSTFTMHVPNPLLDLSTNRLGRSTHQIRCSWRRHPRPLGAPSPRREPPTLAHNLQRLRIRRLTLEVYSSTT